MRMFLTLALALLITSPAFAAKKKAEKKPASPATQAVDTMTKSLTLTEDQKAKLDGIKKDFNSKLADAMKAADELLTPEQKKARQEAGKAAKAAGKTGKEAHQAVDDAMKLTAEQKDKLAEAQKPVRTLQKELRDEDAIRILRAAPREVAAIRVVPCKETCADVLRSRVAHPPHDALRDTSGFGPWRVLPRTRRS